MIDRRSINLFEDSINLLRYNILVQHEFEGGIYEPNQGIFKNIEIDENDKYYPFEICYDFEAMLKPMNENNSDTNLKIIMEHVPVSVSIYQMYLDMIKTNFLLL